MNGFEHATPGVLVLLVIAAGLLFRELSRIKRGHIHFIRRIPGVDAIEGAVGRCAEQGRPVMFTTALTDLGPVLYACLGVLQAVAKKAALYKLKLIVPQYSPEAMAVVEDSIRSAYNEVGRGSSFDPQSVVFLSSEQFAFASGYMGLMHREQPGAACLFGVFAAEALVLAEAGQQVGARQVAASVSPEQVAFFICTCDYTLIGEELFGASAYLSREPVQVATLAAQDRYKFLLCVIIIVGVVCATVMSIVPSVSIPMPQDLISAGWGELVR
jgi:hypothetical protein